MRNMSNDHDEYWLPVLQWPFLRVCPGWQTIHLQTKPLQYCTKGCTICTTCTTFCTTLYISCTILYKRLYSINNLKSCTTEKWVWKTDCTRFCTILCKLSMIVQLFMFCCTIYCTIFHETPYNFIYKYWKWSCTTFFMKVVQHCTCTTHFTLFCIVFCKMFYNIKVNNTWNILQNTTQNIVNWVVQCVQCCTTFNIKVVQLHIQYLLVKLYGVSSNIVHKIVHRNLNYCTTLNNMYNIVQNLVQFLHQTHFSVVQLLKLFMVYNLLYNLVQSLYNVVQHCTGCTDCTTFCTIL